MSERLFRECPVCGGSGFSTVGTGYDNVCEECGGQRFLPVAAPARSPEGWPSEEQIALAIYRVLARPKDFELTMGTAHRAAKEVLALCAARVPACSPEDFETDQVIRALQTWANKARQDGNPVEALAWEGAINHIAKLAAAPAAPASGAERYLKHCEACGTLTDTNSCDCTRDGKPSHFVPWLLADLEAAEEARASSATDAAQREAKDWEFVARETEKLADDAAQREARYREALEKITEFDTGMRSDFSNGAKAAALARVALREEPFPGADSRRP